MRVTNKYTVIALIGIFIFPVFFQSIHIVRHHSNEYTSKSYNIEHKRANNSDFPKYRETEMEEYCPVYEYKLPVNEQPEISVFVCYVIQIKHIYNDIVNAQFIPFILSRKSPRAPPIFSA